MTYSFNDFETLLKENNDCNFVAFAITPLQAVGVSAAISYLLSCDVKLNGYILMTPHPKTGKTLNEHSFSLVPSLIQCVDFEYDNRKSISKIDRLELKAKIIETVLKSVPSSEKAIYFVCTECTKDIIGIIGKIYPQCRLVYIRIDDGFGSYNGPFAQRLSLTLFGLNHKVYKYPSAMIKSLLYALSIQLIEKNLTKKNCMINANIFEWIKPIKGRKKILHTNEIIVPHYISAFKQFPINDDIVYYKDSFIINSQPLKEINSIADDIDFSAYCRVIDIIKKYHGKVLLKPHPRERQVKRYEKLDCIICKNNGYAQEIYLAQMESKPKCIIGIYSSTLANAKGLFDIPAISIAKILKKEKLSRNLRNVLDRYIKLYRSVILFPNDYDELEDLIKVICK